jgi:hypothetical protein
LTVPCLISVMWHVCTLLPFKESCEQRLDRNGHIGNDIVVVIFRDHGTKTKFVPHFASHFNHVFVVVQPADLNDHGVATSYMVQIAAKEGVIPFELFVPSNPFYRFIPREQLRSFLAFKCINEEQASFFSFL